MKNLLYIVCFFFISGCKKDGANSRVDIYVLKSFSINTNQATSPYTLNISNVVLDESPIVKNEEIKSYEQETSTFKLKIDIRERFKNIGSDKGFAVTIDHIPVYYGKFHSSYSSSWTLGLPNIFPELVANNLSINYVFIEGSTDLKLLDKRNDKSILKVFKASHRLK